MSAAVGCPPPRSPPGDTMPIPGPQIPTPDRKQPAVYEIPHPALLALEGHVQAVSLILADIHAELKRANDQRDAWATQVLDVLRNAKEPE